MPLLISTIPTPSVTIHRQFVDSVVDNILASMGVEKEDTQYIGAYGNNAQPGSTIGEQADVSFGNTAKTFLEVNERRKEESSIHRAVGYDFKPPFFEDKRYGIKMSPSFVNYEMTITISRRAEARSMLGGWTNDILRRMDMGKDGLLTQADFHWRIPTDCLNLLAASYRTSQINVPTEETLLDFLRNGFSGGVTVATNQGGKGHTYVMRTRLTRIMSVFEHRGIEREKVGDGGAWKSTFEIKLTYGRPEHVCSYYPAVYNCQLLPEIWWPKFEAPGLSDESGAIKGVYVTAQDNIIQHAPAVSMPVRIPYCDGAELPIPDMKPGEVELMLGQLVFSTEEAESIPIFLMNIGDLGELEIDPVLLDYMKTAYGRNPNGEDNIFRVRVFEDKTVLNQEYVAVDQDLNIWLNYNIDLTKNYRAVLTANVNWGVASNTIFEDLMSSPAMIDKFVKEFRPDIVNSNPEWFEGLADKEKLSAKHTSAILDEMIVDPNHPNYRSDNSFTLNKLTVLNGRILTYRR